MEIWKDIQGFEGIYQVSNFGRLKSLAREKVRRKMGLLVLKERILSPHVDKIGYPRVIMYNNSIVKRETIHRLVAIHFIPNPDAKPCVNHKNGIKTDNRVENLEWCTQAENVIHGFKTGLSKASEGQDKGTSKLKNADIPVIRELLNSNNYTQKEISNMYGVSRKAIGLIKSHKNWRNF